MIPGITKTKKLPVAILNELDRHASSCVATDEQAKWLALRAPTWRLALGAMTRRLTLLRRMQGHQDSLEAASSRESGLAVSRLLQLLGLQKHRRPPQPTCRQVSPVAIVSLPYSLQLLPLQCKRERDLVGTFPGRWMSGFHSVLSSV